MRQLPCALGAALMPFQRDGVLYGLQRAGRCLIADEMGVGKTLQSIALASCYEVGRMHLLHSPSTEDVCSAMVPPEGAGM